MISLSLLPTAHPKPSQGPLVRSSTRSYSSFNLAMGRSPPLRVQSHRLIALFALAFASPARRRRLSLPMTLTPGPIMQKVRRRPTKRLRPLVDSKFQVLFHSPNRGSFHLSLAVLVRYRLIYIFSLTEWSPWIHTRFHVSGATQDTPRASRVFGYGAITPFGAPFQKLLLTVPVSYRGPTTPPG